jgi:hypothetical protein
MGKNVSQKAHNVSGSVPCDPRLIKARGYYYRYDEVSHPKPVRQKFPHFDIRAAGESIIRIESEDEHIQRLYLEELLKETSSSCEGKKDHESFNWEQNIDLVGIEPILEFLNDYSGYDVTKPKPFIDPLEMIGDCLLGNALRRALKSKKGLARLRLYAEQFNSAVDYAGKHSEEAASDIAKESRSWPVNLGPRKADLDKAKKHLADLGLAQQVEFNIGKKPPDLFSPGTIIACKVIEYIYDFRATGLSQESESDRSMSDHGFGFEEVYPFPEKLGKTLWLLPSPDEEASVGKWADACWEIIMCFSQGHPEKIDKLRKTSDGTAKNYAQTYGHDEAIGENSKAIDNQRRKAIKNGLKKAVRSLLSSNYEAIRLKFIWG